MRGGSCGLCRSGPGVQSGCSASSCSVRSCLKVAALAGVGAGVGGELLGWAVHVEACPGVGGVNVGAAGIALGSFEIGVALSSSYWEYFLRRLRSPEYIGVVRSMSSLLLLVSLGLVRSMPSLC